ncbi:MAG: HEAT repeat domain-containing protein, partial [Planctomycetota bacterium]
ALWRFGERRAVPLLVKALSDRNRGGRRIAVGHFRNMSGKKARDALLARLEVEEDRSVRSAIERMLRQKFMKDPRVAPALEAAKKRDVPRRVPENRPRRGAEGSTTPPPPDVEGEGDVF